MGSADITSDARAAVLRDADTLTDWLSAECMAQGIARELRQIRECTPEDFQTTPVGLLVVLAFDAGQHNAVRIAALDAIAERYMATPGAQAYAQRLQVEIDEQRLQDERQDAEEHAALFRRITGYSEAAWPSIRRVA